MNKCYLEGYEDGFVMGYSVGAAHGRGAYHPYEEEADAIMSKARAECRAEMKQSVLCAIADVKD